MNLSDRNKQVICVLSSSLCTGTIVRRLIVGDSGVEMKLWYTYPIQQQQNKKQWDNAWIYG